MDENEIRIITEVQIGDYLVGKTLSSGTEMYMREFNKREPYLDEIKGMLIILVVLGHILPGTLQENPVRYFIYSFHMPAFFFINGFLVNIDRLKTESVLQIAKRNIKRIVVPWLLAVQVYYLLTHITGGISLNSYIAAYIKPYYHLWYVVGYLFCILTSVVAVKIDSDNMVRNVMTVGICITVLHLCIVGKGLSNIIIDLVEYSIRPWYLLFFAIGVLVRKSSGGGLRHLLQRYQWIIIVVFLIFLPFGYVYQDSVLELSIRFILLCLIFGGFSVKRKGRIKFISFLGSATFPIYLWHVIGKLVGEKLAGETCAYYLISFFWVVVLVAYLKNKKLQRAIIWR